MNKQTKVAAQRTPAQLRDTTRCRGEAAAPLCEIDASHKSATTAAIPTGEAGASITSPPISRAFPQKAEWSGGCLIWTGRVDRHGYGTRNGKLAHRVAYERAIGPIPDGMLVCHRCDNRRCINPAHLWLGSAAENAIDMSAKGRNGQQRKTHCAKGHEYTEENTRHSVVVRRHCRACARAAR